MNDPEIKPAPSLPWYRAIVTSTPRGRKLRRRVLLVLILLTVPWWLQLVFSDPRRLAAKLGLREMPDDTVGQHCQTASDCTKACAFGHPLCVRGTTATDPNRPGGGTCGCLTKEEYARRTTPPPGCKDARIVRDTDDGVDWSCSGRSDLGGNAFDGGRERDGGP